MKKRQETCLGAIAKTSSKETNKGGGGVEKRTGTSAAHLNFHRRHIIRRSIAFFLNVNLAPRRVTAVVRSPAELVVSTTLDFAFVLILRTCSGICWGYRGGIPIGGTICHHDRRSFVFDGLKYRHHAGSNRRCLLPGRFPHRCWLTARRHSGLTAPQKSSTDTFPRRTAIQRRRGRCKESASARFQLYKQSDRVEQRQQRRLSTCRGRDGQAAAPSYSGLLLLLAHPNGEMAEYRFLARERFFFFFW